MQTVSDGNDWTRQHERLHRTVHAHISSYAFGSQRDPRADIPEIEFDWIRIAAEQGESVARDWRDMLERTKVYIGVNVEHIHSEVDKFNAEVMKQFERDPNRIHALSPRDFEAFIAAILKDMGCDVKLTPQTRDQGRDILATFKTPYLGEVLTLVECKKYSPERKVGVDVLRGFLYVVRDGDKAPGGIIATSSSFSEDAVSLAGKHRYQLRLADFEDLKEWIAQYGKWTHKDGAGIWIPNPPKNPPG